MYLNPRIVGSGERTLVLSHGYGGSQAIWDKVLPHLSRTNKVLLFDWDFSSTAAAAGEEEDAEHSCYTFSRFAEELVALMDKMNLSGAVYVGHSMAGMVGCIASITRPDLFTHLVLVGASPRYMNSEDYEGGFDELDIKAMLSRISSDFRGWAEGFVPLAIGGSADDQPSAAELLARSFFAMDPRVAHGLARMIFLGDQRELLGDVAVPCTLVHVSGDFAAPPLRRALHAGPHAHRLHVYHRLGGTLPAARHARRDAQDTRPHSRRLRCFPRGGDYRGGGGCRQDRDDE